MPSNAPALPYRLYRGDCLEVLADLKDDCAETVITDIPYNEVSRPSGGLRNLDKGFADKAQVDLPALVDLWIRLARGSIYVSCGEMQISRLHRLFRKLGLTTRTLTWLKTNPSPMNGKRLFLSAMEFGVFARKPGAKFHGKCIPALFSGPRANRPTFVQDKYPLKPLWLVSRWIELSTDPGDIVLDTHMGYGTTGRACMEMCRRFIGAELHPEVFGYARRWIKRMAEASALEWCGQYQQEIIAGVERGIAEMGQN